MTGIIDPMISFDGLNIVVGALCAGAAFAFTKYYLKRKFKLAMLSTLIASTFLIGFYLSSVLLYGFYLDWYIKSEINQNPLMSMVKKYYPNDYQLLIQKAEKGFKTQEEKENIIAQSYELSNRIFLLSLQHASAEEINNYIATTLMLYQKMLNQDPNFIVKFEHGDPALTLDFHYLLNDVRLQNYLKRALNAKKEIIKNSLSNPRQTTDPKVGLALLQSIMAHLVDKYGSEAVTYTFSESKNNFPPEVKAHVIISFFQAISNLDSQSKIIAVRYIGIMTAQSLLKKT